MTVFSSNTRKIATQTVQSYRGLIKPYIITTIAIGTSVTTGDLICQYLESHKKGPDGKQNIQIVKKILTNTLLSPLNISLVFTTIILLQGHTLRVARTKIKNDMPKTFLVGSCYWPFVSFINFRFIPLNYRPMVGSAAGALWNIYISSTSNNPKLNPDGTIQSTAGTATTLLAETSGTGVPALHEAWKTLNKDKKDG
ncbi:unnamed protein product [Adineta steineri]|uniref:Mitochondrial inner membrane protein Mpv17 n=1 Tax=Adineta steineri TaxID=433720 RepID=A0A815MAY9_9BILA|nr:unnamed protein product [Adineta steineri]CAF3868558.1 unnamed protein product [Adineta steineri]